MLLLTILIWTPSSPVPSGGIWKAERLTGCFVCKYASEMGRKTLKPHRLWQTHVGVDTVDVSNNDLNRKIINFFGGSSVHKNSHRLEVLLFSRAWVPGCGRPREWGLPTGLQINPARGRFSWLLLLGGGGTREPPAFSHFGGPPGVHV